MEMAPDVIVSRPLYHGETAVFPHFADTGKGYELIDSTGQSYVDWVNGWGPVLLGYRRTEVEEAIQSQLATGPLFSLRHPIEVEVASLLTEMVSARFTSRPAVFCASGSATSTIDSAADAVTRKITSSANVMSAKEVMRGLAPG